MKLHQEFQIGAHHANDLGSVLGRADIILSAVQTNLAAMKLKGWTDAETTAFTTVRGTFPASTQTRQSGQSDAKKATALKDTDAADLYEHLLTIQNAADLQFPAINPANAATRDEFRLNTFPPDNHTPPAPPAPPQPTPTTK